MFARKLENGNYAILDDEGHPIARIETSQAFVVYPIGSNLSTNYEHPEGIILEKADVKKLGILIEK